ncbi:MAG: hypothetical protein RIB86_03585, partial [Imperialibacter sp.]
RREIAKKTYVIKVGEWEGETEDRRREQEDRRWRLVSARLVGTFGRGRQTPEGCTPPKYCDS